jgi:hypothetical protein
MHTQFDHICAACCSHTELEVEIDSPSDYYLLDTECPICGAELPDSINDEVAKTVTDYYAGQADFIHDSMKDG